MFYTFTKATAAFPDKLFDELYLNVSTAAVSHLASPEKALIIFFYLH